jgi:hypothetical protein
MSQHVRPHRQVAGGVPRSRLSGLGTRSNDVDHLEFRRVAELARLYRHSRVLAQVGPAMGVGANQDRPRIGSGRATCGRSVCSPGSPATRYHGSTRDVPPPPGGRAVGIPRRYRWEQAPPVLTNTNQPFCKSLQRASAETSTFPPYGTRRPSACLQLTPDRRSL